MGKYNRKQKNRQYQSVKYIFSINGIDFKVVAPFVYLHVCTFDHFSTPHKNSGKKFWKVREKYICRLNTTKMDGVFRRQWCLGKFGGRSQDIYNRDGI